MIGMYENAIGAKAVCGRASRRLLVLLCQCITITTGVALLASSVFAEDATGFSGATSDWNGFVKYDFEVDGRACCVVVPKAVASGKPWIWRARFFGHEPQTDIALLSKGFHVAYMDVANLFGNPAAVAHWNAFYAYLTEKHGFAKKAALEGMSRGGLIVYNWASANPEKVACIYADAPVCDIRSWPGGKGVGTGNATSWGPCLEAYSLTETEAAAFDKNPFDNLAPLAKAGIPALHVCGAADKGVPIDENTRVLEKRYRELGGQISVIAKEGVGHHPHSLKNPGLIVDFVLRHTVGSGDYFILRNGLDNCRLRFLKEKKARVAFLGGSITHNPGWRPMVMAHLQERFPEVDFDFVSAGIPSMGSTPGAFRMARDVLSNGKVDLLFQEAAVNDSTNYRTAVEQVRGVEGIVRHARAANPDVDIVMMHFVDPDKMASYRCGAIPEVIANHDQVAEHYGAPSLHLALEVTERIEAGEFTWEDDFKDLHPSPFGQDLYFQSIQRLLDAAWVQAPVEGAVPESYTMPDAPLDPNSYDKGRLVSISEAELGSGWKLEANWQNTDGKGTRKGFVHVPMLVAKEPGAELRFAFQGRAVGLFVAAGPDAGIVEYSIDGNPLRTRDLFTEWSPGLHLPWAQVLDAELKPGSHELTLRVSESKNAGSTGHAVRIAHFLVNE